MTELKTLKDMFLFVSYSKIGAEKIPDTIKENCEVSVSELREEAIKHIKELEKVYSDVIGDNFNPYNKFAMPSGDRGTDANNVIKWIKHFFNITEEELEWKQK